MLSGPPGPFHTSDEFGILCDLVASNTLVCVTGAGISRGLKDALGNPLPGWRDLLLTLAAESGCEGDVEPLLAPGGPGKHAIEAASVIAARHVHFEDRIRELLTPDPNRITDPNGAHAWILTLTPRGIVTFNVDDEHERVLNERGNAYELFNPIDPASEPPMRDSIRNVSKIFSC